MASLLKWGALPDIVSVQEAVSLITALCPEKKSALPKVINDAIRGDEIPLWCLSNGKWVEKFAGTTVPGTQTELYEFGINPTDFLVMLMKRGVPIPDELKPLSRAVSSTDSPSSAEPATTGPAEDQPLPLTSSDLASCFDGLHWNEKEWKKPLGDKPKWLQACVLIHGSRGKSQTHWNPVLIGAALVQQGHAQVRTVRSKFQTVHLLKPWLDSWKTYEADYLDRN